MSFDYILETRDICKNFGKLAANDRISLKIKRNTIHSIVGENGAGKSTLMNILTNIHKADSGEILINGKEVKFKSTIDAARQGIGMVYQEFMLMKGFTSFENIIVGFEEKKGIAIDFKESRKKVERICDEYHFPLPLDTLIDDLPVSVLQQIEIVKVLYRGAEIIILDEPTSSLTPQGIRGLFSAIRALRDLGKTVLFITHKLKEVFEISDEISVLRDGKLIGTYQPSDVNPQKLANLMVGREVILKANKAPHEVGETVLKVDNLSVYDKDGIERVKGVSFDIKKGEILGIAGVAGSGQQHLSEALYGLTRPKQGSSIEFNGEEISRGNPLDRHKNRIGYVPQDRIGSGCNVNGTIWENCIMGYHKARGFDPPWLLNYKQAHDFSRKVVEDFDVKIQTIEDRVGSLSGGNIQKLIVGREFSQQNILLIIEDPTRGIDVGAIEYIWEKLLDFAAQGVSVLMISHDLNEVMQLSDRIMVMYDGHLYNAGNYLELTEEQIGLIMMGGSLHE